MLRVFAGVDPVRRLPVEACQGPDRLASSELPRRDRVLENGAAVATKLVQTPETNAGYGPAAVWLSAGFLLAGMGTVLLGPILPLLATKWHMQDADSGLLLFAKFTGAFVGGVSVPRRLRSGIAAGML